MEHEESSSPPEEQEEPGNPTVHTPVLVVVSKCQLLHFDHRFLAQHEKFGRMLASGVVFAVKWCPESSVEERLDDGGIHCRAGTLQPLTWKDGTTMTNARQNGVVLRLLLC